MEDVLHSLSDDLEARRADVKARARRMSRSYECRCGGQLFFDDRRCASCESKVGYLPDEGRMAALDPAAPPEGWTTPGRDEILKFCANRNSPAACNWMTRYAESQQPYCVACRLNRTIPDLADADNAVYWGRIEAAKRRLISELIGLGLPVRSKLHADPDKGLMFDFLRAGPGQSRVLTGHADGLITINAEEADDAKREQMRHAMREPYRTLLGHFRHEVGHYYWDLLIWDTRWLAPFRQLFGDERASYADALTRNYEHGPPADWERSYISSYATMHPWEDWAETWAHYLHVIDSLTTAMGFGLVPAAIEAKVVLFDKDALYAPDDANAAFFLKILNGWREIVMVLNEVADSMGQPRFYPFTMSKPAVAKLQFVQIALFNSRSLPEI